MSESTKRLVMIRGVQTGQGRLLRVPARRRGPHVKPLMPESLEGRMMLSADPIEFGAVYTEQDTGSDQAPDTLEITFVGGAPGTQLTRIEIDGDKVFPGFPAGLSFGDMIFDTQEGGLGVDLPFTETFAQQRGEFSATVSVQDGSSLVTIELSNFDAGDALLLSVDVDEVQDYDPDESNIDLVNEELDPIASGAEFQGSQLTAFFTAPHYYDAQDSAEFRNRYDDRLSPTDLELPLDDDRSNRDRTAGAVGELQQKALPISLSGTVYEDQNANVTQDASDQGIAGVELSLFEQRGDGFVFTGHTTLTDANGDYSFGASLDLAPGTYEVQESQPDGFFSVGAEVGFVDSIRVGRIADADTLTGIELLRGGLQATDYDFAEARPASIQGTVHQSTPDGDCWDDSITHAPVVGVTIQLLDAEDRIVAETQTDSAGQYQFTNLRPGDYSLIELTPASLIAAGTNAGSVNGEVRGIEGQSVIREITLGSGDDGVEFEFCDHEPATLEGNVFHDRDNDGTRDVGEEGIAGAILRLLDEDGFIVDSVETGDSGNYQFERLLAGDYRVVESQPAGWLDGTDSAGTADGRPTGTPVNPGDAIEGIRLLWGDAAIDYDFGELLPASIGGQVHLSTPDGDCWDMEEGLLEPVAGAVIQLFDDGGSMVAETTTNEMGDYFFADLAPGEYRLREITPEQLVDGGSRAGLVEGVSRGTVDSLGDIHDVVLNSGEDGTQFDFCEHAPSTLSGFVYEDSDNDGLRQNGDVPIAGVTIRLFDEAGNLVAESQTDANGAYTFSGLVPGKYTLRQIQPSNYIDGLDSAGRVDGQVRGNAVNPGDEIQSIDLGWGQVGLAYNFGELSPASLSGFVFDSANGDCWNDDTHLGLAGAVILLRGENGLVVAETKTNDVGFYTFENLLPGAYHVEQQQPVTHFDGDHRAGSSGGDASQANRIVDIDLLPGIDAIDYDFCELPPAAVSGFVFVDGGPIELEPGQTLPSDLSPLRSGELTADDPRLSNVVLELREGVKGTPLDASHALPGAYPDGPIRTVTDENGFYRFGDLPNGSYAVYQVQPEGYIDGIDTPGTTRGIAVNPLPPDVNDPELETVIASLVEPPKNDAIVRIGLFAGMESELNNFSEVTARFVPDTPPPSDPPSPGSPPPGIAPDMPELYRFVRELPPPVDAIDRILIDGSDSTPPRTWHLSIVDGGQPRITNQANATNYLFPTAVWHQHRLASSKWEIETVNGHQQVHYFGLKDALPITGDFDGDGVSEIGVYVEGHWFIDLNGNGKWDSTDLWAKLGVEGDLPVTGDWDGDGKDDIGIFGRIWEGDLTAIRHEPGLPDMDNRPSGEKKNLPPKQDEATAGQRLMKLTARGDLRADLIDHVFLFGTAGDHAIAGDWNGDGIDTVGVFRAGMWRLDTDGNGRWSQSDETVQFGRKGDYPLVGDFNGDGIDDLAIIRNGKVYLDTNNNRRIDVNDLVLEYDETKGMPIVGTWSGDGVDGIGYFKPVGEEQITVAARDENR